MTYRAVRSTESDAVSRDYGGGFTLIEVAVVLFLVTALFLLVVPAFRALGDLEIKSSSRRLVLLVRYLYNEAVFKNATYRLVFDVDGGRYWVERLEGNEFRPSADPVLRRRKLPDGVHFKDVVTSRSLRTSALVEREEFISCFPTGFCEPAIIYLQDDDGRVYTLETIPYTGAVRVYDRFENLLLTAPVAAVGAAP